MVIDRGEVPLGKKKPSKHFRDRFGHTLSVKKKIPWKYSRLVIGTGEQGALPVMPAVLEEAKRRGVAADGKGNRAAARRGRPDQPVLRITC